MAGVGDNGVTGDSLVVFSPRKSKQAEITLAEFTTK